MCLKCKWRHFCVLLDLLENRSADRLFRTMLPLSIFTFSQRGNLIGASFVLPPRFRFHANKRAPRFTVGAPPSGSVFCNICVLCLNSSLQAAVAAAAAANVAAAPLLVSVRRCRQAHLALAKARQESPQTGKRGECVFRHDSSVCLVHPTMVS